MPERPGQDEPARRIEEASPPPSAPGRDAESPPETPAEDLKTEAAEARKEAEKYKVDKAALREQVEELKVLAASPPEAPKDLQRLHLLQIQPVRDILVLLLVLGVFRLGYTLRAVTIPMLLALTLAYLVEPVVERIVARRWTTRAGAAASIILIICFLIIVPIAGGISVAVAQGVNYSQAVRENVALVQQYIETPTEDIRARLKQSGRAWLMMGDFLKGVEKGAIQPPPAPTGPTGATGVTGEVGPPAPEPASPAPEVHPAPATAELVPLPLHLPVTAQEARPGGSFAHSMGAWAADLFERNMQAVGRLVARQLIGTGADAVEVGLRVLGAIGYIAFAIFLILFFFFFFCTGYERVKTSLASLIPKWKKTRTLDLLRQMDEVIAGFVRGRLIIMVILMALFTIGYWAIGVPLPLVLGPIVGILAIIPYAGLVSIPAAIALMWFQPAGPGWQQSWWWVLLAPTLLYFFIQTIDDYVLTPMIQGKTTQMDTPTILFAVLAGGILAGFYGMILAVPAAACLKILWRESFWPRFKAWAEGRVKDFLPISRYDPTETGAPAAAESGAAPR